MNRKLKAKIFEVYGSQGDFAHVLRVHESDVSRVVRGRKELPKTEQTRWATFLHCEPEEVFRDGKNQG